MSYRLIVAALLALLPLAGMAENAAPSEPSGPTPAMQEKIRKINEGCFSCHSEAGLKQPPKEGLDLKKLRGLVRDQHTFLNSDHQRLACTKCHNEGYDEHPHAAGAKDATSNCGDCHSKKADRVEKQFEKSVHAKNLSETFTCINCHNPHSMRIAAKLGDAAKIVAQDNRICLGCHDSDETFAKYAPEKKSRPLVDEIHNWLPNARIHWQAVRCVECHTPAVAAGEPISHEILNKDKAEKKCVSCHSGNSSLKTRLYRHLAQDEQQKFGFANSIVLRNSYVIGATRHPVLDGIMVGVVVLTLVGVLLHAALRYLMSYLRRRNKND